LIQTPLSCVRQVLQKGFGSWKGLMRERISFSFLCVGVFWGTIQQTGAQTYP
jgi:hypothetical protein